MAEVLINYEGQSIKIQCNKNQKMEDICNKLCNKINMNINSLLFLYGGNQLNLNKLYYEISKQNKIIILVYENKNEICSKCGRVLNDKIIDEIFLLNNNLNQILIGLKGQIENIINDINNNKDIIIINSQLKNINFIINNIKDDIIKENNKLNEIKINENKINEIHTKENKLKNEIICIYNKHKEGINLLHDYKLKINNWSKEGKLCYIKGKNNINEKNIDIYINNKKIKFDYKYRILLYRKYTRIERRRSV